MSVLGRRYCVHRVRKSYIALSASPRQTTCVGTLLSVLLFPNQGCKGILAIQRYSCLRHRIDEFPSSNRATECELMNFRVRNLPKNIKISKSFLPQASLPGLVAFQKLGSRMDAPNFVFDGVCEIELQW